MGSARNGPSLLGLPQFPSSNVELGAVSVRNRSAAPGGTGRWPAPRPAFLSREAGEASEGPGATRHVGSQAPSRRVLGRRRSHDIPSARRGSVSRVRGAGGAGKDARRRLPGTAQAGLSAFPRDLCFRMACGRTVVPSAYGTTFVPLAWPHRCTAHPPWEPPPQPSFSSSTVNLEELQQSVCSVPTDAGSVKFKHLFSNTGALSCRALKNA